MKVPFIDLKAQYESIRDEIAYAIRKEAIMASHPCMKEVDYSIIKSACN